MKVSDPVRSFERLVNQFRWMTYLGVTVAVLGALASLALGGSVQIFVLAGSLAAGGIMVLVGIREVRRGEAVLERLKIDPDA